jgi:ABC-type dipeptide/oligopeptide/nickel transport system ATPase component
MRKRDAGCGGSRIPDPGSRLLSVEHLTTGFDLARGFVPAVIDVSFHIDAGETLSLVGESGSGKSLTALSIIRLVQRPGRTTDGRIVFKGQDLRTLAEATCRGFAAPRSRSSSRSR